MSADSERVFSVLVGLDPVRPGSATAPGSAAQEEAVVTDRIARILAQPRLDTSGPAVADGAWRGDGRPSHWRAGALGLVMSAAIAAVTMLLWASPSGGEPAQQSSHMAATVSPAQSGVTASTAPAHPA